MTDFLTHVYNYYYKAVTGHTRPKQNNTINTENAKQFNSASHTSLKNSRQWAFLKFVFEIKVYFDQFISAATSWISFCYTELTTNTTECLTRIAFFLVILYVLVNIYFMYRVTFPYGTILRYKGRNWYLALCQAILWIVSQTLAFVYLVGFDAVFDLNSPIASFLLVQIIILIIVLWFFDNFN